MGMVVCMGLCGATVFARGRFLIINPNLTRQNKSFKPFYTVSERKHERLATADVLDIVFSSAKVLVGLVPIQVWCSFQSLMYDWYAIVFTFFSG